MKKIILFILLSIYSASLLAQTKSKFLQLLRQGCIELFRKEVGHDTYSQVIDNVEWDVNGNALYNTNGNGNLINEMFGLQFGEAFYSALNKIKNNKNNYDYDISYNIYNIPSYISIDNIYYAGYYWDSITVYVYDIGGHGVSNLVVGGIMFSSINGEKIKDIKQNIYKKYLSKEYNWACCFDDKNNAFRIFLCDSNCSHEQQIVVCNLNSTERIHNIAYYDMNIIDNSNEKTKEEL